MKQSAWNENLSSVTLDNYYNIYEERQKSKCSPTGNRTPVSRVTGGDTHHYTIEEADNGHRYQTTDNCKHRAFGQRGIFLLHT
ncbi:hypothetical protein DPMN_120105 [Dreissena polymorpha]|uniref:Uncharacterized protein n=1 Tax=Dreissena polymorpha TaxID=45954 RepID=A0A9D4GNF1_DREPO|nr:hypothetical protein DPMN_120105 [Dreissena polymorpha]